MADIYVRSTDGVNTDDGSTWALAKLDLAGAAAIDAAGDTIYVSDNHAESTGTSVTLNLAGTAASPTKVLCVDDSAEPPTALATTATVTTTGGSSLTINGFVYFYGITFYVGSGFNNAGFQQAGGAGDVQTYENCNFRMPVTGSSTSNTLRIGQETTGQLVSHVTWRNCNVRFGGHSNQGIRVSGGDLEWMGGAYISGASASHNVFASGNAGNGRSSNAIVSGVDFSAMPTANNLVSCDSQNRAKVIIRNCKLPASWSGALFSGTRTPGSRVEMHNCDNADTNYRLWIEDYLGTIKHESTIVRSGGASDGTTPLSWIMTSLANAEYPTLHLYSPEIAIWNDTTGSSKTVTIEVITDNVTLNDDECWLEVMYLGTSGYPLGSWVTDCKADIMATAAAQASSSETWTTTGLATPVKQKLSVSFTPQEKGYLIARVVLAKPSTTLYVDPKLTVS